MQWLLVLIALLGLGAVAALNMWLTSLERMSGNDLMAYQHSLHRVMGGVCIGFGLAASAFAVWLFRTAAATRAERRWPPSSMRTSADVRIRYLTSADALVGQMKGGAIGLSLLALGLFAWGAWLRKSA